MLIWRTSDWRRTCRMSIPSMVILPWVTSAKRCSKVARVLLPAPVAPTRATVSPGVMCRLISLSTSTPGT